MWIGLLFACSGCASPGDSGDSSPGACTDETSALPTDSWLAHVTLGAGTTLIVGNEGRAWLDSGDGFEALEERWPEGSARPVGAPDGFWRVDDAVYYSDNLHAWAEVTVELEEYAELADIGFADEGTVILSSMLPCDDCEVVRQGLYVGGRDGFSYTGVETTSSIVAIEPGGAGAGVLTYDAFLSWDGASFSVDPLPSTDQWQALAWTGTEWVAGGWEKALTGLPGAWTEHELDTGISVVVARDGDAYLAGSDGDLLHWDGTSMTTLASDTGPVWSGASDATHAWLGGEGPSLWTVSEAGTTLAWETANVATVWSAWSDDGERVWVAGEDAIAAFDGAGWTSERFEGRASSVASLTGCDSVAIALTGEGHIVEADGGDLAIDAGIVRDDAEFTSLTTTSACDLWVSGFRWVEGGEEEATEGFVASRRDGAWRELPVVGPDRPVAVLADGDDALYLLTGYALDRWDGSAWSEVAAVDDGRGLVRAPDGALLVSARRSVLRLDGSSLVSELSGKDGFEGWVTRDGVLYAVVWEGQQPELWSRDGGRWAQRRELPPESTALATLAGRDELLAFSRDSMSYVCLPE